MHLALFSFRCIPLYSVLIRYLTYGISVIFGCHKVNFRSRPGGGWLEIMIFWVETCMPKLAVSIHSIKCPILAPLLNNKFSSQFDIRRVSLGLFEIQFLLRDVQGNIFPHFFILSI